MKNTLLFYSLCLGLIAASCGPAAEDREMMHKRARVFQDSIANVIKASMDEAAGQPYTPVTAPRPETATATHKANK